MIPNVNILSIFDNYSRVARLYPALLTLFPPLISLLAWYPYLIITNILITLVTVAMSCGLAYTLASAARTSGKRKEASLIRKWGGWPTTQYLRHSGTLNPITLARYHAYLEKNVPNLSFPSREQEAADPLTADNAYSSAVEWLIRKVGHDQTFPLVQKENAQYGFRRNLLGLKPYAIGLIALTILLSLAAIIAQLGSGWRQTPLDQIAHSQTAGVWASLLVCLTALFLWLFRVTERWVRDAADQYAITLLGTCDALEQADAVKARKKSAKRTADLE